MTGALPRAALDILVQDQRVWVALEREGGPPTGLLAAGEIGPHFHLHAVDVAPAHRRRGHGAALIEAACGFARWAFYPAVTAVVPDAALAFMRGRDFLALDGARLDGPLAALAHDRGGTAMARTL